MCTRPVKNEMIMVIKCARKNCLFCTLAEHKQKATKSFDVIIWQWKLLKNPM